MESEADKIISEHLVSFFLFLEVILCVRIYLWNNLWMTNACPLVGMNFQLKFKDINGLVEQNVKLRNLVRSLSEQIESREMELKVWLIFSRFFLQCSVVLKVFLESQEMFETDLKKKTDEASSKVAIVLKRAEEQGQMIESLHTSVSLFHPSVRVVLFSIALA